MVTNPSGRTVYDGTVQLFGNEKNAQTGVLKVPDFGYRLPGAAKGVQLGAKLVVLPDARARQQLGSGTQYGPGGQEARNPVLLVQLFVGDLGLDSGRPQDVTQLDTRAMAPYFRDGRSLPVPLTGSLRLPLVGTDCAAPGAACLSLWFPELRQYSLFHVKKDQGVPLVYASFVMVMAGLLTKLYLRPVLEARRRRRAPRAATPELEPPPASDYAWLASAAVEPSADAPVSSGGR